MEVVDDEDRIVKALHYDAFGTLLADSNPGFTVPLGYGGGLPDRHTGLVRFGLRDYDPDVGRWTAKDPIGYAGGDNDLYGYCLDDPINGVDPEGLEPTDAQDIRETLKNNYRQYFGTQHMPPNAPSFSDDLDNMTKDPLTGLGSFFVQRGPKAEKGAWLDPDSTPFEIRSLGLGASGELTVLGQSVDVGGAYHALKNGDTVLEFSTGIGQKSDLLGLGAQLELSATNAQNGEQLSGESEEIGSEVETPVGKAGLIGIRGDGYRGMKSTLGRSVSKSIRGDESPVDLQHKHRYSYTIVNPGKKIFYQLTDGSAERMLKYQSMTNSFTNKSGNN